MGSCQESGSGNGRRPNGKDMLSAEEWQEVGRCLGLSPRELSVVRLIFDGQSKAEMAASLEITPNTAHEYLRRIYGKLQARDRVGVVLRVVETRLAHVRAIGVRELA